MEFHFYEALATFISLLFLYYILQKWRKPNTNKPNPPEPPGSWPITGHLHLLKGLPHISLGSLADKHGPIFMLRLGVHRALVVSSPESAKECLGTNDRVFSNRPKTIFVDHLGYESAMMGFSPYGKYWREMRKITTLKLLSNQRIEMHGRVRLSEVRSAIKALLFQEGGSPRVVEMKKWFSEINLNSTVRLIVGKSVDDDDVEYNDWKKRGLRDWVNLAAAFVPGDAIPFLRWFDFGGYEKSMKKLAKEIDSLPQKWLEDHKRRRASGEIMENLDFIDVMLQIYETEKQDIPSEFDVDTVIKATCMAMILGGTDTTSVTLTWALSLPLNNKETLKKAQEELDTQVGKQRQVNATDLKNLTCLQSIIKETMRLYPASSLSVPRESVADCTVGSYHVPAGTRLFLNLYKIHRDPRTWPDPMEFRPERFLTTNKDYDVRGQNFEHLPFGSGKRICRGITFALHAVHFTLASLLHGFEISTPSSEKVDMTEGLGLTNLKASPLEVILVPRLPYNLY